MLLLSITIASILTTFVQSIDVQMCKQKLYECPDALTRDRIANGQDPGAITGCSNDGYENIIRCQMNDDAPASMYPGQYLCCLIDGTYNTCVYEDNSATGVWAGQAKTTDICATFIQYGYAHPIEAVGATTNAPGTTGISASTGPTVPTIPGTTGISASTGPTIPTIPGTRDCSILAIDEFLLQCSTEFPSAQQQVIDLGTQLTTLETNLQTEVTTNAADIMQLQTDVSSGSAGVTAEIQQLQTDLLDINDRIDLFAAKSPGNFNIDGGKNLVDNGVSVTDVIIIGALMTNFMVMIYMYCLKQNGSKKKRVYIAPQDVESDAEQVHLK